MKTLTLIIKRNNWDRLLDRLGSFFDPHLSKCNPGECFLHHDDHRAQLPRLMYNVVK